MNQLKLNEQQSILTLHQAGWSNRAIARELGLNRETVGKYLRAQTAASAPTSTGAEPPKPAISIPGVLPEAGAKPAITTAGSVAGRKSTCAVWEPQIAAALAQGLTAQRIYQDLVTEYRFSGSYQSVKRFVRQLGATLPLPWRRMECAPGLEMQVDFGKGAWIEADGKRKSAKIHPGIDCRAVGIPVPKHAADLIQRCPMAQHFRCERVPENMRSSASRLDVGLFNGLSCQHGDGTRGHEWRVGSISPNEDISVWAWRSGIRAFPQLGFTINGKCGPRTARRSRFATNNFR